MTLYLESNFVLEIVLGQEDLLSAEQILGGAESSSFDIALPSFSLSEPFVRVMRTIRDRNRLMTQFEAQLRQLERSSPHGQEMAILATVPDLFEGINDRDGVRLIATVERLLGVARLIEMSPTSFQRSLDYRDQFSLDIEDAIVLGTVATDLASRRSVKRHLFANRNRSHFNNGKLMEELRGLGCDLAWDFAEAERLMRRSTYGSPVG